MKVIAISVFNSDCIKKLNDLLAKMYPIARFAIKYDVGSCRLYVDEDVGTERMALMTAFAKGWLLGWDNAIRSNKKEEDYNGEA